MKAEIDMARLQHYVILIDDLLAFLSVLVARKDLEVDIVIEPVPH